MIGLVGILLIGAFGAAGCGALIMAAYKDSQCTAYVEAVNKSWNASLRDPESLANKIVAANIVAKRTGKPALVSHLEEIPHGRP